MNHLYSLNTAHFEATDKDQDEQSRYLLTPCVCVCVCVYVDSHEWGILGCRRLRLRGRPSEG